VSLHRGGRLGDVRRAIVASVSKTPPLSIVVATGEPWPTIEPCLERILPQARAVGAEVIVADAGGTVADHVDGVISVVIPGASVFELRAKAAERATGRIVAFTEDHCMAEPDWCERIITAHENAPNLAMIGGAMENGSTSRLIDWANYLPVFSPFMPPLMGDRGDRVPPPGNISFKKEFLPIPIDPGELIVGLPGRLHEAGLIGMDETILMSHHQEKGFFGSFVNHFHNGRSTTGLGLASASKAAKRAHRRLVLRAAPRLLRRVAGDLRRRKSPLRVKMSLPLVAGTIVFHTIGELVGLARGPGRSPDFIT